MTYETNVGGIEDLNPAWPEEGQNFPLSESRFHHRNEKLALQGSFAEIAVSGGNIAASAAEMNNLVGTTGPIQPQLDAMLTLGPWAEATYTTANGYTNYYPEANSRIVLKNRGYNWRVYLPRGAVSSDGDVVLGILDDGSRIAYVNNQSGDLDHRFRRQNGTWATNNSVYLDDDKYFKATFVTSDNRWWVWGH